MTIRVLIVEDNPIASRIEKSIVIQLGCEAECALTGEDGVQLATKNKYDLILMDVGLPGISGIETAVMIRSKYENINKKTPIIAVTANHDQATRNRCIEAGLNDFLEKPLTLPAIHAVLARFYFK